MINFGFNSDKKKQKKELMLNKINELEKHGFGDPSRFKIIRIYIEEDVALEEIDKQYMKKILREFKKSTSAPEKKSEHVQESQIKNQTDKKEGSDELTSPKLANESIKNIKKFKNYFS